MVTWRIKISIETENVIQPDYFYNIELKIKLKQS